MSKKKAFGWILFAVFAVLSVILLEPGLLGKAEWLVLKVPAGVRIGFACGFLAYEAGMLLWNLVIPNWKGIIGFFIGAWQKKWALWRKAMKIAGRLMTLAVICFALFFPAVMFAPGLVGMFPKIHGLLVKFPAWVRMLAVVCYFVPCFLRVQEYQGVVIAILGIPWRSKGAGPGFIWRPFGIPLERVVREVKIERIPLSFLASLNAKNRDTVPGEIGMHYEIDFSCLLNYFKMDPKKREEAIKKKVIEMANVATYKRKDRDKVFKDFEKIGKEVTAAFRKESEDGMSLEEYFGIKLVSIFLSDIEPPKAVVEAEQQKEIEEERRAAARIKADSIKERAEDRMKLDPKLSLQKAIEQIHIEDGIVTKKINEIGVDDNLAGLGDSLLGKISGWVGKP